MLNEHSEHATCAERRQVYPEGHADARSAVTPPNEARP